MRQRKVLVATVLLLGLLTTVARPASIGVRVDSKTTIAASMEADDTDSYAIDLIEGDLLTVAAKAAKGKDVPDLVLALFAGAGSPRRIDDWVKKNGSPAPVLKKYPVPAGETGTYRVVISGDPVRSGNYQVKFTVKATKLPKRKGVPVEDGETVRIPFAARDGSTLKFSIRERSGPPLASVLVADPDGVEIPGLVDTIVHKGSNWKGKKLLLDQGTGLYELVLASSGGGDAVVDVALSVKAPKPVKRKATLPSETAPRSLSPETFRQGDGPVEARLYGSNFLAGTTAEILGAGVTGSGFTVRGPSECGLSVTVADDAPFGLRNLVLSPPELLGEPVTLFGAFEIIAPIPTLASYTGPATIKQGETDRAFELSGTGFRAGGSLHSTNADVLLSQVRIFPPDRVTGLLTVPADAAIGTGGLEYRQPDAGGGDTVEMPAVVTIHYSDAIITGVDSPELWPGDSNRRVVVHGYGFKSDGTVSFPAGSGLTIDSSDFVSDRQIDLVVDVDESATAESFDLTYAHPVVGGGATTTYSSALTIGKATSAFEEIEFVGDEINGGEEFGVDVETDGTRVVVGAFAEKRAYVFRLGSEGLTQEDRFKSTHPSSGIEVGKRVALTGNTAFAADPSSDRIARDAGDVTVREYSEGVWSTKATLYGDNAARGDAFGHSMDADGDRLVVGSANANRTTIITGRVTVFHRSEGAWQVESTLTGPDTIYANFGFSVGIDDRTIAVGCPGHGYKSQSTTPGAVYVYRHDGESWNREAILTVSGSMHFGFAVAVEGDTIAVGRFNADDKTGAVHVYQRKNGTWSHSQKLVASDAAEGHEFGMCVSLSGDFLAAGAPWTHRSTGSGTVYLFRYNGTKWSELTKLRPADGGIADDLFGYCVSNHGSTVVAGAAWDDAKGTYSGTAYVFRPK